MKVACLGVSRRPVKLFTARCICCRGEWRFPAGYALTLEDIYAHECWA